MQMKKKAANTKKRKRMVKTGAVLLAVILTAAFAGTFFFRSEASDRFPGVDSIISRVNTAKGAYTILEIEPESGLGEIGYYVKDGEYHYLTSLMESKLRDAYAAGNMAESSSAARTGYFNEIRDRLIAKGICAPDGASSQESSSYPISGGTWTETFFLPDGINASDWHRLTLPNTVTFDRNGSFTDSTGGNTGDFDRSAETEGYETAAPGTGAFDVTFTTGVTQTSDAEAYANAAKYGAYELQSDNTYKKVANTYRNETDYYVKTVTANADNAGSWNALYKYTFNPEGTGAYSFVPDDSASMRSVPMQKLYYSDGFTNNELLLKDVFGITDTTLYPDFKIQVVSATESELSQNSMEIGDIPNFDMLFIAGDSVMDTGKTYAGVKAAGKAAGKTDMDYIDFARMQTLLNDIFETAGADGSRSCIVDYSIFDAVTAGTETIDSSCVYKLAASLLQDNVKKAFETNLYQKQEDSVNWSTILTNAEANDKGTYHNFAKDNVYCWYDTSAVNGSFNGTKHGFVSRFLSALYTEDSLISSGFQPVVDLIDSENTIRSYSSPLGKDISQARAIQYIINSWSPRKTQIKKSIRILEIEPCASYDLTTDCKDVKEWAADLRSKAESEYGTDITFTIDQMTTSEFIGKINDLNTNYDMIYIGMNTGRMNTDGSGRTVYNDKNMNGLVYTHQGDYVFCADELGGILDRDYVNNSSGSYLYSESVTDGAQTIRYGDSATNYLYDRTSGSFSVVPDTKTITMYNAADGRYETVSMKDVGVYRFSGDDITSFKLNELIDYVKGRYAVVLDDRMFRTDESGSLQADDSYIDNSSCMYQFLDAVKSYDNVITCDSSTKKLSNTVKFESYLNMNKPELTAADESSGSDLMYAFRISSNVETDASTSYRLSFFVDINADGQYSSLEELKDCIVTTDSGEAVSKDGDGRYLLKSNVNYVMKKSLGSSYIGYIPYKIEVSNADPEYASIRTDYTGSYTIPAASGQYEDVRILQIMQRTGAQYSNNFNMQAEKANASSSFSKLLAGVSGYSITITSIPEDTYEALFDESAAKGENYLDNYNMVVMGFADVYMDISNTTAPDAKLSMSPLGGILKFIQDGKSVLFTHDNTSFVNTSSLAKFRNTNSYSGLTAVNGNWSYWGYNINSVLRSVVGMDRFGVTGNSSGVLGTGDVLYFGSGTAPAGTTAADKASLSAHDYSFAANSGGSIATGEVQGYTNCLLNSRKLNSSQYYSLKNTTSVPQTDSEINGAYSGKLMWASQINSGQITEYPYKIDKNIPLSTTHYQYYQLDLDADDDADGASDIVVWYTISDVTPKGASEITDANRISSIYSSSPNDVRNNYYIYSKGNVMYSGVGHSALGGSEMEMKLYINTMIAAYKNGAQSPSPTIRENSSITSPEKSNEYIAYDDALKYAEGAAGSLDQDLTINYEVEDPNLITGNKTITASYYIEDANGSEEIPGTGLKGIKLDLETSTADGTVIGDDQLVSGNMYRASLPDVYSYLGTSDTTKKIFVVLTSSFNYYGKNVTVTGYDTISLVREQLFNLN